LAALVLFVVVTVTFSPAIQNGFLTYDDPDYVTANFEVQQGITWNTVRWAFTAQHSANWHPVTWLSHALDCQLFSLKPWGHHLVNVLIHAVNSMLAFVFFRRATGQFWPSFFLALFFGVHPLRVESVAWVAERKDVLSTFFFFLTLLAYVRYAQSRQSTQPSRANALSGNPVTMNKSSVLYYGLALGCFTLGLMSKQMLVTLPFILLLLDYWPLKRLDLAIHNERLQCAAKLLLEKIPFLCLAVVACVITLKTQSESDAVVSTSFLPLALRGENASVSLCRYIGKTVLPINLSIFYPFPPHWPTVLVIVSLLVVLGVTAATVWLGKSMPYLPVGWLWYVGSLIPVIGLVQAGAQSIADRYTYIPSIGLLIIIVWTSARVLARAQLRPAFVAGLAAVPVLLSAALTWHQIGYWKDPELLFRHALSVVGPDGVVYENLGCALVDQHRYDEALQEFRKAEKLGPFDPNVHADVAKMLWQKGLLNEAIIEFQNSLKFDPHNVTSLQALGVILAQNGKANDGIGLLEQAVRLDPMNGAIHFSLADALAQSNRHTEALKHYQEGLVLSPNYVGIPFKIGLLLAGMNRPAEAVASFREAIAQQPTNAQAHYLLGGSLADMGVPQEAVSHFEQSLRLDPANPQAHLDLARALDGLGRLDSATEHYQAALKLNPQDPEAHNSLGASLASRGRLHEAAAEFRTALELQHDFPAAQANLDKVNSAIAARQP
jgi:tetratricopeptide (TPR) repeat protein